MSPTTNETEGSQARKIIPDQFFIDAHRRGVTYAEMISEIKTKYGRSFTKPSITGRMRKLGLDTASTKRRADRYANIVAARKSKERLRTVLDLLVETTEAVRKINGMIEALSRSNEEESELIMQIARFIGDRGGRQIIRRRADCDRLKESLEQYASLISEDRLQRYRIILNAIRSKTHILSVISSMREEIVQEEAVNTFINLFLAIVGKESLELRDKIAKRIIEFQRDELSQGICDPQQSPLRGNLTETANC